MNTVYLLLGSNQGNREEMLDSAIAALGSAGIIQMQSSIYETAAWGKEDQPAFLNKVVVLSTVLNAEEVLSCVQFIEQQMQRQRIEKWGQRTLDIDILFFNNDIINTGHLVIPHPFIQQRRFTLMPLCEIAPDFIHPVLKKSMSQLLADCTDMLEVQKI